MLLDNIYGLLNLFEFKINHFNSLVQAKSEFKNSNFGGKYIEIMSSLMFSNKYDFSNTHNIEEAELRKNRLVTGGLIFSSI